MKTLCRVERNIDGSQTGRGSHKDSAKDVTDGDAEKSQLEAKQVKKKKQDEKKDQPPILKYIKTQVGTLKKHLLSLSLIVTTSTI